MRVSDMRKIVAMNALKVRVCDDTCRVQRVWVFVRCEFLVYIHI